MPLSMCSNCLTRVLPKEDGTCPSCGSDSFSGAAVHDALSSIRHHALDIDEVESIAARLFPLRTFQRAFAAGMLISIGLCLWLMIKPGTVRLFGVVFYDEMKVTVLFVSLLGAGIGFWGFATISKLLRGSALLFRCAIDLAGAALAICTCWTAYLCLLQVWKYRETPWEGLILLMLLAQVGWVGLEFRRGYHAIITTGQKERKLLLDSRDKLLCKAAIERQFGVPPFASFVPFGKRLAAWMLFINSSLLLAGGAQVLIQGLNTHTITQLTRGGHIDGLGEAAVFGYGMLKLALLVVLLLLGSNLLSSAARTLVRIPLQGLIEQDPRPPVLFLRSFRDDQVKLKSPKYSLMGRILALGLKRDSLDHVILEESREFGPVVALGNPTDKCQPFGAARGYYTNDNWQSAVEELAMKSRFIVFCIDDTAGVKWEIEHLVEKGLARKTLFLLHPENSISESNQKAIDSFLSCSGNSESEISFLKALSKGNRSVLGFFFGNNKTIQCGLSTTFSREAYTTMVRAFFRYHDS